jgi:hypothetical protein
MSQGIESGIGNLWFANQTALGSQAATAAVSTRFGRKATDDTYKGGKTHGREPYVDGAAFDSSTPFVEGVGGDIGKEVIQGQVENAAAVYARQIGVDVVTGAADPWTHTIAAGTAGPVPQTIREKTGAVVGPVRLTYWDAILNHTLWNCSQDQNISHLELNALALKAGEISSLTDPVAVDSGTDPFRWGEAAGALTINAVVFSELDGDTLDVDRGWDVHRGDNVEPAYFVPGRGAITRSFSGAVTDTLLPEILLALYGSTTPAPATRPTSAPSTRPLKSVYTRSASRALTLDTPKVEIKPDDITIGAKPQGGLIPITFGGQALASGSAALTVTAKTGDSVSYVTAP